MSAWGGGIYLQSSTLVMSDCDAAECLALNTGGSSHGGILYGGKGSNASIYNCTLRNSTVIANGRVASYGGAVDNYGGGLAVIDCIVGCAKVEPTLTAHTIPS